MKWMFLAVPILSILLVPTGGANAAEVTFEETFPGKIEVEGAGKSDQPAAETASERISPDQLQPESPPETSPDQLVEQPAPKLVLTPRARAQPKVVLTSVSFEGNTALSDDELGLVGNSFLNRPLRSSDLEQLRVELTRAYTDRGYVSSGAVLPDQSLSDGQLTYQIIEGQIDSITVEGTGRLRSEYVADRVRLGVGSPLNSERLQESFQLLLDDPLIERMDGQLLPLPQSGFSSLKLRVTPSNPYRLKFVADNHGAPSVGAEQLSLTGTYLNPTGYGDSANLSLNLSPGRYDLSGSYSVPLNARDTRLAIDVGLGNSNVIEAPLDNIDIESESTSLSVSISHPLSRTLQGSVRLGTDLTVRDNSNTLLGRPFNFSAGEEEGESRLAALRFWLDTTQRRSDQVIALRSTISVGIDAFGSTIHSDDLPDSEFIALLGQAQFIRSVFEGDGQLVLRADAQIANEELLPLGRFAVGGPSSVRGYRKNQLVRDQGVFASVEYRHTVHASPERGVWQVAPFVDYGLGRNRDDDSGSNDTLFSVGAGVLWSKSRYNAELYLGHAIEDVPASGENNLQDEGVYFRFSSQLY